MEDRHWPDIPELTAPTHIWGKVIRIDPLGQNSANKNMEFRKITPLSTVLDMLLKFG